MPAKKNITKDLEKEEIEKPKKTTTRKSSTSKKTDEEKPKTTRKRTTNKAKETVKEKEVDIEVKPKKRTTKVKEEITNETKKPKRTRKVEKSSEEDKKTATKTTTRKVTKKNDESKEKVATTRTKTTTTRRKTTQTKKDKETKTDNNLEDMLSNDNIIWPEDSILKLKPENIVQRRVKIKPISNTDKKEEVKEIKEVKQDVKKDVKPDIKKDIKKDITEEVKKEVIFKPIENIEENEEEKVDKIDEKSLVKKENKQLTRVKLSRIEKEIKKQKDISQEKQNKINKRIFRNILIANAIVLYFIFFILGYNNLEIKMYTNITQILSIVTIFLTIVIFEISYKKDNDEIALHGIEMMFLSIISLLTIYIYMKYKTQYIYIINTISMFFAIYYVGKSIIIYSKMKKKALKRTSDIRKIRRIEE